MIEKLITYRLEHELTWNQIADLIGVTRMSIWKYRDGQEVGRKVKTRIENFLKGEK